MQSVMKLGVFIVICLCSGLLSILPAYAHLPTVESLFKNGSNAPITANYISLKMKLTRVDGEQDIHESPDRWIWLVVFKEELSGGFSFQGLFSGPKFSPQEIYARRRAGNVKEGLLPPQDYLALNASQKLFYGILDSLVFNSASSMALLLNRLDPNFKFNRQLINQEKRVLLEEYRKYLLALKSNPKGEGVISPLRPEDEELGKRARELFYEDLLRPKNVTLTKEAGIWGKKVSLNGFQAFFKNENHHLAWIKLTRGPQESWNFYQYLLFTGQHQLPKYWVYQGGPDKIKIEVIELTHKNIKGRGLSQFIESYGKKSLPKKKGWIPPFLAL